VPGTFVDRQTYQYPEGHCAIYGRIQSFDQASLPIVFLTCATARDAPQEHGASDAGRPRRAPRQSHLRIEVRQLDLARSRVGRLAHDSDALDPVEHSMPARP
jgi:hypothetical protein